MSSVYYRIYEVFLGGEGGILRILSARKKKLTKGLEKVLNLNNVIF